MPNKQKQTETDRNGQKRSEHIETDRNKQELKKWSETDKKERITEADRNGHQWSVTDRRGQK